MRTGLFDVNYLEQQIDTRLVVNTRIKIDVLHQVLREFRLLQHVRKSAVASPMVGHRATPVWNDKTQVREIRKQIALK